MRRILASLLILLAAPAWAQEALPSIVVMADGALSLPLAKITREYARSTPVSVAVSLGENQEEGNQIVEGGSADILITAHPARIRDLKQQGLVDIYSEITIAADRLALVAPLDSTLTADLNQQFPTGPMIMKMGLEPVFVMPHPETLHEGSFAREAMRRMRADADMEPYVVYLKQRAQIVHEIEEEGAYGIMLASDAQLRRVKVLGLFPESTHAPIVYTAVVLAGDNMTEARKFLSYLRSNAAEKHLADYGFSTPPKAIAP